MESPINIVLPQIKATDLDAVYTLLQDSIIGLRHEIKTKLDALTIAGHESPVFSNLVTEVANLSQTVEVLVKALADTARLIANATKTLDRVQRRLVRRDATGVSA